MVDPTLMIYNSRYEYYNHMALIMQ